MSKRAEDAAIKAYPEYLVKRYGPLYADDGTDEPVEYDENIITRKAYIEGYEQAEKDLTQEMVNWLIDCIKSYVEKKE